MPLTTYANADKQTNKVSVAAVLTPNHHRNRLGIIKAINTKSWNQSHRPDTSLATLTHRKPKASKKSNEGTLLE